MTATAPRVIAEGRLVRLREKQIEDAWRDYSWRKDRELADYDATRPITMTFRAYTATITEDLRRPSKFRRTFAIEDRESGRHIGNVMYYGYDSYLGEAELGITIGERAYWSRGYGSEAVRCLLGHLFTELELRRVYLHTLTTNTRAQHAFRRAGFRRLRSVRRDGYDFERMEISREEYAQQERDAAGQSHERDEDGPASAPGAGAL